QRTTQQVGKTDLQKLLHWPTSHPATPPDGWRPEFMDQNFDILAKKLQPQLGYKRAYDISNYVLQYSANPIYVKRRASEQAFSSDNQDDMPGYAVSDKLKASSQDVDKNMDLIKQAHERLKANNYRV